MRVRKLDLLGFKSFATKTTVQFEPGVTAIVGPNGSGKSNLVDCIRWVLGEHNPRDVRAPRLEDVIFNGTDHTAPLSMAEVSLTIDNDRGLMPITFSEVQITRRVYRSGESECFINQSPCRLKDIHELFMGTGLGGGTYAIIEQGHIDLILSSKPEERRRVFEEASGIARYLAKKQETLRRLDEVEQDLTRVADIAQEVRRQLNSLERQAARARQYKTQWEQLKNWELRLAADELVQGDQARRDAEGQVATLVQNRDRAEVARQELLAALDTCNAAVAATQSQMQDVRTRLVEAFSQIEQHTSQQSLKTRWVEELTQQRDHLNREVAQAQERSAQLAEQLKKMGELAVSLTEQHSQAQQQHVAQAQALQGFETQLAEGLNTVEQAKQALFGAAARASQARNQLASVAQRLQQLELQMARVQEQRRAVQQRLDALTQRKQQLEREGAAAQQEQQALQTQVHSAQDASAKAHDERQQLIGRVSSVREQLLSERAKAQLLEEVWRRHEGFPDAVKALLVEPPEDVLGLLADVIEPEPGYARALEAALGPLASAIVVRDRQALRRSQQYLAGRRLGSVHVVVLSDAGSLATHTSASGSLAEHVRHDAAYAALAQWLLGSWSIADNLAALSEQSPQPIRHWVTKTGERWDGVSWQLGDSSSPTLVGRKQQWEQAQEALIVLEQQAESLAQVLQRAEEQWQSLTANEQQLKNALERSTADAARLNAQVGTVGHDARRLEEDVRGHQLHEEDLLSQQRELTASQASAERTVREAEAGQVQFQQALAASQTNRDELTQQRQQCLLALAQLEASTSALSQRQEELRARVQELQGEHQHALAQEQQKLRQVEESAAKARELNAQLESHQQQITELTARHQQVQRDVDRVAEVLRADEARRDQVMPKLLAVEQDVLTLTQTLKDQEAQLAERNFRRAHILERLQEVYQLDDSQVVAEQSSLSPLGEQERQELAQQVEKLKAKLGTMGPVNLGSVEEYDELKQRQEFLQTQQQDLLKAQEDLRHSIQQINRTARAQFRDTFTKIQQEFQHYFTRLFGGGQSELILLDEDDVLESGIEIMARPPGKRPQSISLLSGGERALTAIALLFALFKVRPSPFCILDEIDAPLDEANVDRFTKVLEEFLSLSQFILITHNKKTITKADSLYGVTMEQPGISKIVSVKLSKSKAKSASEPEPPLVVTSSLP